MPAQFPLHVYLYIPFEWIPMMYTSSALCFIENIVVVACGELVIAFSGNKHIGLLLLQASAWHKASPSAVNLHRNYSQTAVDSCKWHDSQSNSQNKK